MLDKKQAAHVLANRAWVRRGRLRTVTLIQKTGQTTTYATAQCTWKEARGAPAAGAHRAERAEQRTATVTAEFAHDVDFSDAVAVADTPDQAQVARARKYRIQELLRLGLTGTPNRIVATLVEMR